MTLIMFAAIWSRFFRRGPMEYLLNTATKPAKHIR
ncbi:putative membrane protein YeiB [Streptomyces stelliscabiei]|uniref:Putative membrane protein YeiB n=1 Tax=Streptomyces stelliscabiei TaxID=146820 RepID=A0A8I0TV59_9ACTN|nr:putative membrane protein YeiB [Streptomyces stelliscabiei]